MPSARLPGTCHGYRPGLKEPCQGLTLLIPLLDGRLDAARLDALDRTVMAVFDLPGPYPADRLPNDPGAPEAALAGRVLWLGTGLLEALAVPVFETGCVHAVTRGPTNAQVKTLVPMPDGLPPQVPQQTFVQTLEVLLRLLPHPADFGLARQVRDRLHDSLFAAHDQRPVTGLSAIKSLRAAFDRDIPFRHVGEQTYQLGWGCRSGWIKGSAVENDSGLGGRLTQDKRSTAAILRRAGFPAADHVEVATPNEALEAAQQFGWPVVIKPADRDRGEGVVAGIRTVDALLAAFHEARRMSASVLVERHVPGVCHRLMVIGGELQFVSKRMPKGVLGDGTHSVAHLVAEANRIELEKPPWKRLKPFPTDERARVELAAVGLTFDSVPAVGVFAPLRTIQSMAEGGVPEDFTDRVHPDNAALACRAARLFRLEVAGIDMISTDIARSWRETGAIINEVNFAPLLGDRNRVGHANLVLVSHVVDGDGRIPVEVFVGGDEALAAAQRRLAATPPGHVLTSHALTLDASGERPMAAIGLFWRCLALIMDRAVTGLIVVVQTDEWLDTGMPVDRLTAVSTCPGEIHSWRDPGQPVDGPRQLRLLEMLSALTISAAI